MQWQGLSDKYELFGEQINSIGCLMCVNFSIAAMEHQHGTGKLLISQVKVMKAPAYMLIPVVFNR